MSNLLEDLCLSPLWASIYTTMGRKSSRVAKRGLWQNQAQGSSAICCNWLKHEGKETRKHNHHELARTNACTILTSAKMAEICLIRHHVKVVVQRKLQNEDSNLTHQTFSFSAASPSVISIKLQGLCENGLCKWNCNYICITVEHHYCFPDVSQEWRV